MAVQTAHHFLRLLSRDKGVRTQFLVTNPLGTERVLDFAGGKGFIFTEAELHQALEAFPELDFLRERLTARV